MQIFIHCKTTLHALGVTAPIIRSIKNCTRSLRYRSYFLYRYSPPTWSDRDHVGGELHINLSWEEIGWMLKSTNTLIDQNLTPNELCGAEPIFKIQQHSDGQPIPCPLLNHKVPTCHSSRQCTTGTLTYLKGLTKVSAFKTWLKAQVRFGCVMLAQLHLIGIQQHPIEGTTSTVRTQHATLTLWNFNTEYDGTITATCGQACYK